MTVKSILSLLLIFQSFAFLSPAQAEVKVQLSKQGKYYKAIAHGTGLNENKCRNIFTVKNLETKQHFRTKATLTGLLAYMLTLFYAVGTPEAVEAWGMEAASAMTIVGTLLAVYGYKKLVRWSFANESYLIRPFEEDRQISFSSPEEFAHYFEKLQIKNSKLSLFEIYNELHSIDFSNEAQFISYLKELGERSSAKHFDPKIAGKLYKELQHKRNRLPGLSGSPRPPGLSGLPGLPLKP